MNQISKRFFRHMANMFLLASPTISGLFSLKRVLLKCGGIDVAAGACVNGHTWFYGRGDVRIGRDSWIGPRVRFYSDVSASISIGSRCDIGPEVSFVTGSHNIGNAYRRAGSGYCRDIVIGDGCWIGARAIILGGVRIGDGSVIGAGAVVVRSVPPNCIVAGVPARKLRDLD